MNSSDVMRTPVDDSQNTSGLRLNEHGGNEDLFRPTRLSFSLSIIIAVLPWPKY